jgi:hypothetical protein
MAITASPHGRRLRALEYFVRITHNQLSPAGVAYGQEAAIITWIFVLVVVSLV